MLLLLLLLLLWTLLCDMCRDHGKVGSERGKVRRVLVRMLRLRNGIGSSDCVEWVVLLLGHDAQ
jgi:hypothetical protein